MSSRRWAKRGLHHLPEPERGGRRRHAELIKDIRFRKALNLARTDELNELIYWGAHHHTEIFLIADEAELFDHFRLDVDG